jgi:hypothetical protein
MVSGGKPFRGLRVEALGLAHVSMPVPLLHDTTPGAPEAFSRAVARAMSKDRSDRQPTAGQLIAEMRDALGSAGTIPALEADGDEATAPRQSEAPALETSKSEPLDSGSLLPAVDAPAREKVEPRGGPVAPGDSAPDTVAAGVPSGTRRLALSPLAAGAAVAALGAAVVGAWWFATSASQPVPVTDAPAPGPVARVEAPRYLIELNGDAGGEPGRVSGDKPILPGQGFRFHFTPRQRGYFYIVARAGEKNVLTTFLTSQPERKAGVTTNLAAADADFVFPAGDWLRLDDSAFATPFTVVFSPVALSEPAFFGGQPARSLTAREQQEFEEFSRGVAARGLETGSASGGKPEMAITLPPGSDLGGPVVFDISVKVVTAGAVRPR